MKQASSRALAPDALLALQELPRAGPGWATEKQGLLQIVSHRGERAWRGAGVAFHTEVWTVVRRVAAGRGVWIQLKHLQAGAMLSVGSVHLTPGATHAQSKQEMAEFMGSSPKGAVPAVCQCDANASIRWRVLDGEVMPVGVDGKANEVVSQLVNARFQLVSPGEGQWATPTSRPRQAGRKGHIIDYLSVRGIARAQLQVHVDSHIVLGTDHELLEGTCKIRKGTPNRRFHRDWGGAGGGGVPACKEICGARGVLVVGRNILRDCATVSMYKWPFWPQALWMWIKRGPFCSTRDACLQCCWGQASCNDKIRLPELRISQSDSDSLCPCV